MTATIPQGLEPLAKPKQKFTLLAVSALGCTTALEIVTRGEVEDARFGPVLTYTKDKERKKSLLMHRLKPGAIILKGHGHFKMLESQTNRYVLTESWRFHVNDFETPERVLAWIKDHLVAHTVPAKARFKLFGHENDEAGHHKEIECDFNNRLREILGPPVGVEAPPLPPPRKSLLTDVMKGKLIAARDKEPAKPIFKIFNPSGVGTWLLCSMEEDGDTLWAVCDIGQGCVEYGTVSLEELETTRGAMGMHLERDLYFTGATKTLEELVGQENLRTY